MLSPDELIESGFAGLRNVQPTQSPTDLVVVARRREKRTKIIKTLAGSAGGIGFAAALTFALQPTSALAALQESASLTAAQPFIHLRSERTDVLAAPAIPPYPPRPALDIWKLHDSYIRQEGHTLSQVFKNGKILSYDNRFPFGTTNPYNELSDHFWEFDGSIGVELNGAHKESPKVRDLGDRLDYGWHDVDGMQNQLDTHVFVDKRTKLVNGTTHETLTATGDKSSGFTTVDYPSARAMRDRVPGFPKGLRFCSQGEAVRDFRMKMARPEQTKTIAGIRVDFYGVLIYPNTPDGIAVNVLTTGGATPEDGGSKDVKLVGVQLLPTKRSQWLPSFGGHKAVSTRYLRKIGGRDYIVNQSDDLLTKAPAKLIVKVPVWKGDTHTFAGYLSFTTQRVFANPTFREWNFYDAP